MSSVVSVSEWRCRVQVRLRVCTSRAHINAHVYVRVSAPSLSLCFRLSEASTSSSLTSGQHHRFKMAPKPPSLKIKMSHVFSPSQFYRSLSLLPSRRGGRTRSPHPPSPPAPTRPLGSPSARTWNWRPQFPSTISSAICYACDLLLFPGKALRRRKRKGKSLL